MSKFYEEVLGLKRVTDEKGWREFAARSVTIALHSGPSSPGRNGPKIVFHAGDVSALREKLVARDILRCLATPFAARVTANRKLSVAIRP